MIKTDYITISEAAEKWELSVRQVQNLCKGGSIVGAVRFGHAWMIPKDAQKPMDRRTREEREKR